MREFPEVRLELEEESGGGDGEKRLSRWDDGDDAKRRHHPGRARAPHARAVVILSEHKYWDKLHSS